jgi:hypothetical protein
VVRPRRARPRAGRTVVSILVVAAILLGIGIAVWRLSSGSSTAANAPASAGTTTATPTATGGSAGPSTSSSASTSRPPSSATEYLAACQAKVRAADAVIAQAKVGVGHWATHVQAQTSANAGAVTLPEMSAIFKRTRLAGPGDVQRYNAAVDTYRGQQGRCTPVAGAPDSITASLATCADRAKAQAAVLTAADNAMADWKSHLAAMQRSKMGHVNDPQGVWIRTWRAAPPHIKAFQSAVRGLSAPSC